MSILSGAHDYLFPRVMELLRERGVKDLLVLGGGVIPEEDIPALKSLGVQEVFGPGTSTDSIVKYVRRECDKIRLAETAGSRSDWKAGTRRSRFGRETMKILKIDHIGIAAKSIDQVAPFWNAILGLPIAGKGDGGGAEGHHGFPPRGRERD